jgi:hypothetical protein
MPTIQQMDREEFGLIISVAFLTVAIAGSFSAPAFSQTPTKQSSASKAAKKKPCSRSRNAACY